MICIGKRCNFKPFAQQEGHIYAKLIKKFLRAAKVSMDIFIPGNPNRIGTKLQLKDTVNLSPRDKDAVSVSSAVEY